MPNLFIDIETYSPEPLQKSGMYRYAQNANFDILLFAYSVDGGPVNIVDFACGEALPPWLYAALSDPAYIKYAYNAAFELTCLTKFAGPLPAEQWRCLMLQGLYCGYPVGLDAVGRALGLPEDKQKQAAGRVLIRYFCVPCAPSKTNGGRRRNFPQHNAVRWELFRQYCAADVVAEIAIYNKLINFPVPPSIQKQWETDYIINSRGVAVDMELVQGALMLGADVTHKLTIEAIEWSGLENPNSISQLKAWLNDEFDEDIPDLRKNTVSRLLSGCAGSEAARRMLEIRQELGKTSTKKYNAIEAAVCADGRVRGLLQFYGANRTGRWAGRLVQVQNLPRTYAMALPMAREAVKNRKEDKIRVLYGSVPDTLSQLIRTAFIAKPGHILIGADFASIEARVISWLAGEAWRLEVFKTHGKIYEAAASRMFGVPMDRIIKGQPEYELRQRGKVAELALGYQGGPGALMKMGALEMGLTEDELPEIVRRWRDANQNICKLWYDIEDSALLTLETGAPAIISRIMFAREIDDRNGQDFFTIRLPSGRELYYAHPVLGVNKWGSPCILYSGMDQTSKRWKQIDTYGGKLVENITQAIARDCLADAIERLEAAGYPIVMHVHDEVVIECPEDIAAVDKVCSIMTRTLPWAPDLPMGADGWVNSFYVKD